MSINILSRYTPVRAFKLVGYIGHGGSHTLPAHASDLSTVHNLGLTPDVLEYFLSCADLNTPAEFLERYCSPLHVVLDSGELMLLIDVTQCHTTRILSVLQKLFGPVPYDSSPMMTNPPVPQIQFYMSAFCIPLFMTLASGLTCTQATQESSLSFS